MEEEIETDLPYIQRREKKIKLIEIDDIWEDDINLPKHKERILKF